MEEWYAFNEEKLKVISLITASLVLIVAIYRWLVVKWRSDVDLRKYSYFIPLKSRRLEGSQELIIEVPEPQQIHLWIESEVMQETLYNELAPGGTLKVLLEMNGKEPGDYLITMQSEDQKTIRKVFWSGLYSVQ